MKSPYRPSYQTDMPLLLATLALAFLGLLMITSSSYVMAAETWGDRYFYVKRHLISLAVAAIAYAVAVLIDLKTLRRLTLPFFICCTLLLLCTIVSPFGDLAGGANRWLRFAGFRFQPSEFARLATILVLAHLLTRPGPGNDIRDFRRGLLLPLALVGGVALLVLCEPDFGTAVSIGLAGLTVIYVAGARLQHLVFCLLAALPGAVYAMAGSGYRRERLLTFLDPWQAPLESGFQIIQSFISMRAGGFFGKGIGDGVQKIYYLPEAHTDFVFAILGEELGFVGVCGVIMLFIILVGRGVLVATRCQNRYCAVLAAGLSFAIGVQAFTNMAVVMGLLPTKGLTLPLISFGGSSLVATCIAIGLIQNIARREQRGEL